jgi:hypothetical protein
MCVRVEWLEQKCVGLKNGKSIIFVIVKWDGTGWTCLGGYVSLKKWGSQPPATT